MATTTESPRDASSPRRASTATYVSDGQGGDFVTARSVEGGEFVTARSTQTSDGDPLSGPAARGPEVYLSSSSNDDRAEFYSSRDDANAGAVTMPFVASPVSPTVPVMPGSGSYSITVDPSQAHRLPPSSTAVDADARHCGGAAAYAWGVDGSGADASSGAGYYSYPTDGEYGTAESEPGDGAPAGGVDGTGVGAGGVGLGGGGDGGGGAGGAAGLEPGTDDVDPSYVEETGIEGLAVEDVFSLARHNKVDRVAALLERGLPVNVRDSFGNTILSIACQNGLKRMAKAALRKGADMNAANNYGNTPLHFAYMFGYGSSLGEYLMSKGADASVRNNDGLTCFEVYATSK